jgi:hypothetical protein
MIRCESIIHGGNEDQAFIAEVPELLGCVADGATYQAREAQKPNTSSRAACMTAGSGSIAGSRFTTMI